MRDALERIQKSGRHLLSLINDVLDLSKIKAGQFALTLGEYLMQQVVQSVSTAFHPLASAKHIHLACTVSPDLPLGWGDERRITQVLLNLVGNAIKFTDAGTFTRHRPCFAKYCFVLSVVRLYGLLARQQLRLWHVHTEALPRRGRSAENQQHPDGNS